MKCPDCGWSGDETFCSQCSSKLNSEKITVCKGKLKDGSSCRATLSPEEKFCRNCVTTVNAALSPSVQECSRCGNPLQKQSIFCSKCKERNEDIPGKCCNWNLPPANAALNV